MALAGRADVIRRETSHELRALAALFLRLGFTAFGGPAAHIAMMRDEVVRRRQWLSDQQFLDLVGATNLIPGPNSTEMAIHIGSARAGWRGLTTAGVCFIAPAMLIVLVFAWAYTRFGATPQAEWLLYGVKPVIIAIVAQALWSLGRAAVKTPLHAALALGIMLLYWRGINEIALLAVAALAALAFATARGTASRFALFAAGPGALVAARTLATASGPVSIARMFLVFAKIGSVLYGSGYVLLAFLRADFVVRLGWLTDRQLLDAIAIGQFTPGPVFTTATFIGYLLGGVPAAVLATAGIFLPAFIFVAASHPLIPRLRRSPLTAAVLDGVNAAALALMAGVTVQLGRAAVVDPWTAVMAVAALAILLRTRVNSAWLVLAGALAGVVLKLA